MSNSISWLLTPFTLLSLFLLLVFATGGSSWPYESQLIVLRPIAVLFAAWGLATMQPAHWHQNRIIWGLFGAATLLTIAHLVPLPYSWWSSLPGRQIIADIDAATGLGQIARPFSMHPDATQNALFSLAVPWAILSLGAQLDETAHRRIAGLLVVLIAASAFIGLLQLSGARISLYETVSEPRPSGLFNNRNHQGALLSMAFPLALLAWKGGYHSGALERVERGIATALAIVVLPLAVVTGSRAGFLLTCFALILALVEVPWKGRSGRTRSATAAKIAVTLAPFGLLVWFTIQTGRDVAIARLFGSAKDSRYPVWESILDVMSTYWPWGTGVGAYAESYQIHEPDELLRPTFSNHAHNEWLEIAFTSGLPGILILAAAATALALGVARAWRLGGQTGAVPRVGAVVIFLLALASTSDYPVRTPIMMAILALSTLWLMQGAQPAPPPKNAV